MCAIAVTPSVPPFLISDAAGALHVSGELDLAAVPELRARVRAAAATRGAAVVDLSGVEFIDVAGLTALSSLAHEARQGHWQLDFRCAPLVVRQLARLTGLQDLALAA
jgi:anti-anti-sigma factor